MSPFFCTRKSIPQPVRCKSKPLDGTPQCAFHRFCLAATRLPHSPPRRHLLIGGLWGLKNRIPFKGKPFAHPIRYGCFLHGAIPFDRATAVQPPAQPYGFARFAYPRATRPPRHVPRQRMGGGTAGFDVFRGGLGRVGNDGREGGPLPPLRRPVEGAQGLEQAMTRHAGDCDRAGGCRRIHAKRRARSHLACFLAVMPSCPILR